jgi:hypothetical protein
MRRRNFIALLSSAAVWPLAARAAPVVRFKNDLDVKEIVNPWTGGFAAVKSMLGRHWNECAKASDHLCSACRYIEPD